jgi:hypothetical protein
MKKPFPLLLPAFLSFLALLFTSCGSSPSSVMEDMISEMNAMTETLKGIKSQEDFDSAKEDLEEHGKKMKELSEELEDMKDDVTAEEKKEMMEKYGPKIMAATLEMSGAAMKAAAYGFKMPDMN